DGLRRGDRLSLRGGCVVRAGGPGRRVGHGGELCGDPAERLGVDAGASLHLRRRPGRGRGPAAAAGGRVDRVSASDVPTWMRFTIRRTLQIGVAVSSVL